MPGRPTLPVSRARSAIAAVTACGRRSFHHAAPKHDRGCVGAGVGLGRRPQDVGVHPGPPGLSLDVDVAQRRLQARPAPRAPEATTALSSRPSARMCARKPRSRMKVRTRLGRQVERGLSRQVGAARVDDDDGPAVSQSLDDRQGEHRVRVGDVRADDQDHVGGRQVLTRTGGARRTQGPFESLVGGPPPVEVY